MMQYYSFHIGDYTTSAAHLTLEEDATYRRLIDLYYKDEQPLSLDLKTLCRRARVNEETATAILEEFFVMCDDGWHNQRCDEELAKMLEKSGACRKAAEARWGKQKQCVGNANAMQTHSKRNADGMPPNTQYPIPKIECNLKPLLIGIQRRYGTTPDMNGFRSAIIEAVKSGFKADYVKSALDWLGAQTEWEYVPAFQTPNKLRDNLPAFYAKSQEGVDVEEVNIQEARRIQSKDLERQADALSQEELLRELGNAR